MDLVVQEQNNLKENNCDKTKKNKRYIEPNRQIY